MKLLHRIRDYFNKVRKHPYFGFIVAAFLLILVQLFSNQLGITFVNAIGITMIYYIAGLGFTLLLGYAGLASLATASFIGLGTFTMIAVMQVFNLPFIVALAIGIAIAIVLGVVFGFVSLRIEGMYLAIVTLGISEIIVELFKNFSRFTGGTSGITLSDFTLFGISLSQGQTYYLIVTAVVLAMILTLNLINSPSGRAMLAIKNSDSAAQAMGISLLKYRLFAFVISTIYAVVAGLLYMAFINFSNAGDWGLAVSLNILAAVIVGGAKSIWGVFIGTFLIFGLDLAVFSNIAAFNGSALANIPTILSGVLIIVVVMFYPGGVIRLFSDIKNWAVKKYHELKLKRRVHKYGEDE